jgi:hypothetical protein
MGAYIVRERTREMRTAKMYEAEGALCRETQMWGLYISWGCPSCYEAGGETLQEIIKAAPFLNFKEHSQQLLDGYGFFLFNTEEEQLDHYWQVVGDDGPTKSNPYKGPARVYALTFNPKGQLMNENT